MDAKAKAVGRYLRVTSRKARFVLDEVRGKSATEALNMLKFIPNEAATYIRLVIQSAVANAEHNFAMDPEALKITTAFVDQGPTLKRIHPRAMGRAYRILKRSSHITIEVTEDEALKAAIAEAKTRRPSKKGKTGHEVTASQPKAARKTAATATKPASKKEPVTKAAADSPEAATKQTE
ncbi:MAG: 50S ribosomal protein L22 [Armatimonadota bacterium]